ncbi:MAG: MATE family efflux transporter [Rhodospirillaceae bacterium]|nr:MATE family efflux transporter [Rhodospirillaceae bacterium]MBT5239971.1 MATE family efflux transporter [Rhodospirillaceae bacterium]MBT5564367.1 MATE family efflux transporter [Rhodospirillaceae bacterium]MBT6090070.1 MATE family efflux transporter [Rhodospirillaceae bacterium]
MTKTPSPHSPPTTRQELRATLHLALPLAGATLAQMGMGLTDTIMLGSVGRDALAAGGLGGAVFFMISGMFQNVVASIAILIAHARGADDTSQIDAIFRAGLVLALIGTLPLLLMLWNVEPFLLWVGEPPSLAADVTAYIRIIIIGTPAIMILAAMRFYLSAMNHPRLILIVSIIGLFANGLLDYGLIYGVWGLPEMGFLGAATATAVIVWVNAILTAIAIIMSPALKPKRLIAAIDWSVFLELNKLGWPIAALFSVETLLFMVAALLMGTIGTTALAAHQVTIMIAATAFMMPLAVGQAANVRIGYHMGANLPAAARRAGFIALGIGLGIMSLTAAIMLAVPRELALLFQLDPNNTEDAVVIALVIELLSICVLFQIFDGAQAIGAGVLRGYKDTRIPMMLATLSYWGIGFSVAWTLAFPLGFGPEGLWWGLATGLAAAAILLCGRFAIISKRALQQ